MNVSMSNKRRFRLNFKSKLKSSVERIPTSEIIEAKDLSKAIIMGVKKVKEYDRLLVSIDEV